MKQGTRYCREIIAPALATFAGCIHPTIAAIEDMQEWAVAFTFLDSQDYREGVQSFLNKTTLVFPGK